MKILETERLLLRGLEQGDFKDVCKLLQDDEVMYAYEGAFNDQEVQNWLDRQFGRYRHDGFGLWGVVEKGSNELIGQCGITYQEFDSLPRACCSSSSPPGSWGTPRTSSTSGGRFWACCWPPGF